LIQSRKKIFVSDTGNNRVLRFASLADLQNGADAEAVLGQADFYNTVGATSSLGMRGPVGLAIDAEGRLWVADAGNHRILRFDGAASKADGAAANGVLGQANFTTSDTGLSASGLNNPQGVAVDGNGRLWVADTFNNRVLRFDGAASKTNGAPANGVLGQTGFTSKTIDQISIPFGVAVDSSGRVWVVNNTASTLIATSAVLRFDNAASKDNGTAPDGILGTTTGSGITANRFSYPTGAAVDSQGTLWVADYFNNRVLRFDNASSKTNGAAADGVLGQTTFGTNGSGITQNRLNGPYGLAVDANGTLLAADSNNNRVLVFANQHITFAKPADATLNQSPVSVQASASSGLAVTITSLTPTICSVSGTNVSLHAVGTCTLKASQAGNGTTYTTAVSVQQSFAVTQGPKYLWSTFGQTATLVIGHSDFVTGSESNGSTGFKKPQNIAIDPTSNKIFVADRGNHRVLRFATFADLANGAPAEAVFGQPDFTSVAIGNGASGMNQPFGAVVDNEGRLWVADTQNNRVLRFDKASSKVSGANADAVLGQANFSSNSAAANANGLNQPTDLTVTNNGTLWVVDSANNRALKFNAAASKSNGGNADVVLGQANFNDISGSVSQSRMNRPYGITIDGNDRLWVADFNNHRVLRFNSASSKTNGANADGVLGQTSFTANTSGLSQSRMNSPYDIVVDAFNTAWISEYNNHRVLRFDAVGSKANGANADGVLGQSNFTSNVPSTSATGLRTPAGLALDESGALWVADSDNHRILLFSNHTINFAKPADKYLGNPMFALNATTIAGEGIEFTSTTPSVCTVNGPHVSLLALGTCTIKANYIGDRNAYTAAPGVVQSFEVKQGPTITWATPAAITYGTALSNSQLNASASIPGTMNYSVLLGNKLPAGTHTITATFTATDTSYGSFQKSVKLTVNKAPLTITAQNASRDEGKANPSFTVTYSGFVNGEDERVLGGTLTFNTNATINSPAGTYTITPSGLTSSNYAITYVNGTLTVRNKQTFLPFVVR
jgi:sugar lactone lactonase YvrE